MAAEAGDILQRRRSSGRLHQLGIAALAATGLVCACSDEKADIQPTKRNGSTQSTNRQHAAEAEANAEPEKAAPKLQYSYSSVGKRDPFRSYLADLDESDEREKERRLEETERYELDQFRLVGIIAGTAQPKALVEDPTGTGHTLRIGSRIGRNGGRVTRIFDTDEGSGIIVTEEFRDPTGARVRTPYRIILPKPEFDLLEGSEGP